MKTDSPSDMDILLEELHQLRHHLLNSEQEADNTEIFHHLREHLDTIEQKLAHILQEQTLSEELNLLSEIALMLARTVRLEEVLAAIIDGLQKLVPYDAAGIFIPGEESGTIKAMVIRGYREERLNDVKQKVNEGIVGWVISNAEPVILHNAKDDPRYISARDRTRSEMAVPIISGDEVVGCINIESDRIAAFSVKNLLLVQDLASQAAVALERARTHDALIAANKIKNELQIARAIQGALLPGRAPQIEGYDFGGRNHPSKEIGGDYYDFIPVNADNLGIVIADVAGKGVPAGLIMSGLRAALRTRVETTYSIRQIISGINRFLYESTGPERFVTVFYGVLNTKSGLFTYVNSGHPPPLLLYPDDKIVTLEEGGPLLGVVADARYQEASIQFPPGSLLCMYTDGITEAGVDTGEQFGEEKLIEILREERSSSASEIADRIEREAAEWNRGRGSSDDRTVVMVKRL